MKRDSDLQLWMKPEEYEEIVSLQKKIKALEKQSGLIHRRAKRRKKRAFASGNIPKVIGSMPTIQKEPKS